MTATNEQNAYLKYRGKCKEFSEELAQANPTLSVVRGYYHCTSWGEQAHWWCITPDGTIIDPTKDQFPSKGLGDYEPFDGTIACENCGKIINEENVIMCGPFPVCSSRCGCRLVGV